MSNVKYTFGDIEITATTTGDITTAIATMVIGGEVVELAAYSKKNSSDKRNDVVGVNYAIGRVLKKLSKRLMNEADGLSKHADDMKLQKKYGNNKSRANRRTREQNLAEMSMLTFIGLKPSFFSEEYEVAEEATREY